VDRPDRIGVVRLDSFLFLRTTGGVMEPDYDRTQSLKQRSARMVRRVLSRRLKAAEVRYPVPELQGAIDRFSGGRLYLQNVLRSIEQLHYQTNTRPHLVPYPLPDAFLDLKDRGYSHLLFYSVAGAVATKGRIAMSTQRFLLFTLLGNLTVPVQDLGTGRVVVLDLRRNTVDYYNRIIDPRRFTLSADGDLKQLIESLLQPYLEEVRAADGTKKNGTKTALWSVRSSFAARIDDE